MNQELFAHFTGGEFEVYKSRITWSKYNEEGLRLKPKRSDSRIRAVNYYPLNYTFGTKRLDRDCTEMLLATLVLSSPVTAKRLGRRI